MYHEFNIACLLFRENLSNYNGQSTKVYPLEIYPLYGSYCLHECNMPYIALEQHIARGCSHACFALTLAASYDYDNTV